MGHFWFIFLFIISMGAALVSLFTQGVFGGQNIDFSSLANLRSVFGPPREGSVSLRMPREESSAALPQTSMSTAAPGVPPPSGEVPREAAKKRLIYISPSDIPRGFDEGDQIGRAHV